MTDALHNLALQIINAARAGRYAEAVCLMKNLPHDKFTAMTISSVQKKLVRLDDEELSRKEKRDLNREMEKEILAEMGIR
jgi:hypothetical protein